MRVLVAGGSGFIGRAIVNALVERGDQVFVATRRSVQDSRHVSYDRLPDQVDAVINLAGESVAGLWTPARKRAILESRVQTIRRLVDWMLDMPGHMPVLLSSSAVGWYGDRPGEALTEESASDPNDSFRGRVCRAWEEEAERAAEFGARVVRLRIGNVLDFSGGLLGVARPLLRYAPILVPPVPEAKVSWVSLDDAVGLILFAIDHAEVSGPLNVTSPHPTTYRELTARLAELTGKRTWGSLPKWLLRALLWENSEAITDSQDVRPAKALEYGYEFEHVWLADWIREVQLSTLDAKPLLAKKPLVY